MELCICHPCAFLFMFCLQILQQLELAAAQRHAAQEQMAAQNAQYTAEVARVRQLQISHDADCAAARTKLAALQGAQQSLLTVLDAADKVLKATPPEMLQTSGLDVAATAEASAILPEMLQATVVQGAKQVSALVEDLKKAVAGVQEAQRQANNLQAQLNPHTQALKM